MDVDQIDAFLSKNPSIKFPVRQFSIEDRIEVLRAEFECKTKISQRTNRPCVHMKFDLSEQHGRIWFEWMITTEGYTVIDVRRPPGEWYTFNLVTVEKSKEAEYNCLNSLWYFKKGITLDHIKRMFGEQLQAFND